jgi:hypothetical protein
MWDPVTHVERKRGYIHASYGHYYVMQGDEEALNWKELESEARREVVSRQWEGDISPYYPLSWELFAKAEFPPREQDKEKETYLAVDDEGRVLVRHLEYGKPVDQWQEPEAYITHFRDRYYVQNNDEDGIALNWRALEPEARAVVERMGEEFHDRYIVECPPEIARKALFQPTEEFSLEDFFREEEQASSLKMPSTEAIKIEMPSLQKEEQISSLRVDSTHEIDFGR